MFEEIYVGSRRAICWVADASGHFRGKEFFEALPDRDRAALQVRFERVANHEHVNKELFRSEGDGIFCFKKGHRRMACFIAGGRVLVTHGFNKKTKSNRRMRRDIERAKEIRTNYYEEEKEGDGQGQG